MERQYKHGLRKIVLALPAGYCENDEVPLDAAQRELLEETGYAGGKWVSMGSFTTDGNRGGGKAHLILANDVEYSTEPRDSDLEEREVLLMSIEEVRIAFTNGALAGLASLGAFFLALDHLKETSHD